MTSPKRPKASAASPDQVVELYGPEDDGWYDTRVMDWIALCEQLKDGEVRGYLVLRSLVIDKFKNHVRKLTLQLLCELIPSPSGGPSSLTRVRGILDGLTRVGLVTTPEGKPIKTSSRASAVGKPLRIRINDAAPEGYQGWRNTEDKLKALGTALAELVDESAEDAPAASDQAASEAGRKSDPAGEAGRKSDPMGRKSDPRGRESDPHTADELGERDLPLVSSSGSSLSPSSGDATETSVTPKAETEKTRETASPEDNPAPAAAAVPAPRDGGDEQTAEALAMLVGLPGQMHRDDALDLVPLVDQALAIGWTLPQLRSHLSRKCDPERVFDVAAIYRKHLKRLPDAPAGVGAGHPAAAPLECDKCKGSGLAEDPETFLPIGPCECRKAPALAAAS
ncbi:hypothetical protein [Streptomyces marianii]|uniref:Uncharacterized protein n=1 Tax=Streptomyces marianii TaxID=1817406 RepID=A0A5R9DW41_9ACTN|nr:hypothetical protein [Streptomyces marianii]TLQ38991.1 hypothetical protein FEF34_39960 [Streptomyces marianii]